MASFTASNPGVDMEFFLSLPAPVSTAVVPNAIVETFANGNQLVFSGNLLEGEGKVVGGTFDTFSYSSSSGPIWSISGFAISSLTLQIALETSFGFLNYMLSGHDTYTGSPTGTDTLIGVSGNDTFIGGNGNETFVPKSGNNMIVGGLGYDVVVYSAAASTFQISDAGGAITLAQTGETDSITNISAIDFSDGILFFGANNQESFAPISASDTIVGNGNTFAVDIGGNRASYTVVGNALAATVTMGTSSYHLTDVSRIQFADGLLVIGNSDPGAEAYRLYQAAFDRVPDNAGLKFWTNELTSGAFTLNQAANFFAVSPEFIAQPGTQDNNGFVTEMYANVLGRVPDSTGFQFWVDYLAAGHSRGDVLQNFSESAENVALVAPHISGGIWIV